MGKRVFLIVLDSFGIGEAPDASEFGDTGSNTLRSISASPSFSIPNLTRLGFTYIDGIDYLPRCDTLNSRIARLSEKSRGKDTTVGHWEIAGVVSDKPLPVFPEGFPAELISQFENAVGRRVLCNKPYSGTQVIADYGEEHLKTGALIVYTSADSVFQIAAHESVIPPAQQYDICRTARRLLTGKYGVGRVIARPFTGEHPFTRTSNRRDFSLEPPGQTMLDKLFASGRDVIAVGKIHDIFADRGITRTVTTKSNEDGINRTPEIAKTDFNGLCFVNLVDFDMLYGHRNDIDGYAAAISYFDSRLPELLACMGNDDILMITADHGCDPATPSTDHSREYTPFLAHGNSVKPENLGTLNGFTHISDYILDYLLT